MPIYVIGTRQLEQTTACYQEGEKNWRGGLFGGGGGKKGVEVGQGHTQP